MVFRAPEYCPRNTCAGVQPVNDGGDHAGQVLRPLPGGVPPVITTGLRLFGVVAAGGD